MTLMWEANGYEFWVEELTGEVATVKVATGEILFSNPWDVPASVNKNDKTVDLSVKKELLSQLIVNYVDNNSAKTMYSCTDAASRGQINVEYIKNGIRVEYSIGRQETRMLVPMQISAERFETKILKVMRETVSDEFPVTISDGSVLDENGKPIASNKNKWPRATVGETYGYYDLVLMHYPEFDLASPFDINSPASALEQYYVKKVASYYTLQDPEKAHTDSEKSVIEASFPITKKMPIYVLTPSISDRDKSAIENYIKSYVVSYTYEELDYDHELVGYVSNDKSPPLFKMALEYSVDELGGFSVRLPANGIRFDESLYQLTNIEMLPYMGAGQSDGDETDGSDGYTFFPDGSGALFGFDDLNTISGKVYGRDYAYHQITGTYQEAIRYPVFGIVENWEGKKTEKTLVTPETRDPVTNEILSEAVYSYKVVDAEEDKGFVAIIEEGDALAELSCDQGGSRHMYNAVKMIFSPRPKDSYNMADAISVGSNTVMTVVSKRKYVGNYKVRYIMLSDDDLAFDSNLTSYYECSWMGMALAYRDYLEKTNVLSRLSADDVDDDIPLYIETFGTLMTTEKFLSIPVDVMTPLTTFDDIVTMYNELSTDIVSSMKNVVTNGQAIGISDASAKDFSNINFKLTGYANGGMFSTAPDHLNWEAAVGGASGFEELVEISKDKENGGFGIFPDFDFLYINSTDWFDGVSLDKDAVKTIDNRYTSRREYSATYQTYVGYFQYAITPSSFDRLVTKFTKNYLKYNPTGISLSTFGTDLNSDFNEDDPLNREDSKTYTIEALNKIAELKNDDGNNLGIMVDGGNAYTWKYIDYIVNMPLNSSRYNNSTNAVPFMGVVLHGFIQFAGTPINEEGDLEYAMLKAIENGAGIYFTLSYQNTQKLKDNARLSEYFSVRYDIWKEDIVNMYVELDNLLADLQTKLIIDHESITGERVPDSDEVLADKEALEKAEAEEKAIEELKALKEALKAALNLRHTPNKSIATIENAFGQINERAERLAGEIEKIDNDPTFISDCAETIKYVKSIENAINETKRHDTYIDAVHNDVIAAIEKNVTKEIEKSKINSEVEKVVKEANKALTDDAKKQANTDLAEKVKTEVTAAVVAIAAEEAFRQRDIGEAGANAVIAAVKAAASDKITALKNAAADEDKTLVENVGKAITTIIEGKIFSVKFATTCVDNANTNYKSSTSKLNKVISAYADKAEDLQAAVDTAMTAEIEAVIKLQNDVMNAVDDAAKQSAQAALDAKIAENNEFINAIITAHAATVEEIANLDDAGLNKDMLVAAYAIRYDQQHRDTSYYKQIIQVIYNAYSQTLEQVDIAQTAYSKSLAAIYGLDDRRELMNKVAAEAYTQFRVYAIAYLATSFTKEQLEELSENIDADEFEGDPKPEYLKAVESADYANAIKVIDTKISALESAYNNATGDAKAEAKVLYDAAIFASENEAEDIVKLYVSVLADYKAAKKDADNAENFHKTAIAETAVALEKLKLCESMRDEMYAKFTAEIRQLNVDVIGKDSVSSNNEQANAYIDNINGYFSIIKAALDTIVSKQTEISAIGEKAKTVKAELDVLKAKRYNLTVSERERYDELKAQLEVFETQMNILNTEILEEFKPFQETFKFLNTTIPYLADTIAVVDSDLANAELLFKLLDDANEDTSEVGATVEYFKGIVEDLHAKYDAIRNTYAEICNTAVKYNMVSENENTDELYRVADVYTYSAEFINEVLGKNEVEEEKEVTKYTCDDGSIVAVTYGGKNGNDREAYRTFLLNYNSFAVTVVYNGVSYKLDGYAYHVINH